MWSLWHQYVFVCALWSRANTINSQPSPWRMRIVCGERGRAMLMSLGQVANSFLSVYLLPRLPSSSTYSFHPLTDPSDQDPALAPLHPIPDILHCVMGGGQELRVQRWELCKQHNYQLTWTMNHPRGLHVSAKDVQRTVCHEHEYASRRWRRECFIVFRSLPHIGEELQ